MRYFANTADHSTQTRSYNKMAQQKQRHLHWHKSSFCLIQHVVLFGSTGSRDMSQQCLHSLNLFISSCNWSDSFRWYLKDKPFHLFLLWVGLVERVSLSDSSVGTWTEGEGGSVGLEAGLLTPAPLTGCELRAAESASVIVCRSAPRRALGCARSAHLSSLVKAQALVCSWTRAGLKPPASRR